MGEDISAARMLVKSSVERFLPRCLTILSSTPLSLSDVVVTNTVSSILSACCKYPNQFLTIPLRLVTVLTVSCTLFGDKSFDRLFNFLLFDAPDDEETDVLALDFADFFGDLRVLRLRLADGWLLASVMSERSVFLPLVVRRFFRLEGTRLD